MSLESGDNKSQEQQRIRDRIAYPHAEAVVNIFNSASFDEQIKEPVQGETIRDIMHQFLEELVEHTEVFESKDGVAFPMTRISLCGIAHKLYEQFKGRPPEISGESPEAAKTKVEFVFPSFLDIRTTGHEYTFQEEAMHQMFTRLPAMIESLNDGKEPDDTAVYLLGSPTNELGTMTPEFLEGMRNDHAFEQYGSLYAEFVRASLAKEKQSPENVQFYGISMGGSFALQTAKKLLDEKVLTQERDEADHEHLPFLQIRADGPAGQDGKRRYQIPAGFAVDAAYSLTANPYINAIFVKDTWNDKTKGQGLITTTDKVLADRNILPHMTKDQEKWKGEGNKQVIENLRNGVAIPENVKVTQVVGLYDLTTLSQTFNRQVREQREEHAGSLGESLVRKSDDVRAFGADMSHTLPSFRDNELRRIYRAAKSLENLKE